MVALLPAVALTLPKALILFAVGIAAGIFNGVAGGGTLLTFPALLALGVPALSANITSTVGVLPSYLGSIAGFRSQIKAVGSTVVRLLPAAIVGGSIGAVLLVTTPATSFRTLVPWLILLATVLFALQPMLARRFAHVAHDHPTRGILLQLGTVAISIYGGYFGAAMGVMMLAVFGICLVATLAEIGGIRSILSLVVNALAAVIFIVDGHVLWLFAAVLALGTLLGGWIGARLALSMPVPLFRLTVVVIGAITTVVLFAT